MPTSWVFVTCFVTSLLPWVTAYSTGPPVFTDRQPQPAFLSKWVCDRMDPYTGHNKAKLQTAGRPYIIEVAGDCYKEDMALPVYVRRNPELAEGDTDYLPYFTGMFVQARRDNTVLEETDNVGTFSSTDPLLKGQPCYYRENSSISHAEKDANTCKTFTWMPPAGLKDNITFQGTLVYLMQVYWMDQRSPTIMYKDDCSTPVLKDCDINPLDVVLPDNIFTASDCITDGSNGVRPLSIVIWIIAAATMHVMI